MAHVPWVFLSAAVVLLGQAAPPRFEVVSLKECRNTGPVPASNWSPGRLSLSCWQLDRLILDAYDVYPEGRVDPRNPLFALTPVDGLPEWVKSARYFVDGRAEGSPSPAMMRGPMMQAVLKERFHLKTHRETREVPVYVMTVDKSGAKLQHTAEGACNPVDPMDLSLPEHGAKPWCVVTSPVRKGNTIVYDVRGITLDVFCGLLRPGRPVIDRTGLSGAFEIHLEWEPDPAGDPTHTAAVEATRKQLGLRLEPGRGPVEFLVVDHIERPTEN